MKVNYQFELELIKINKQFKKKTKIDFSEILIKLNYLIIFVYAFFYFYYYYLLFFEDLNTCNIYFGI